MKFGHRGGSHPVKNVRQEIEVTSQNHSYAVDAETVPGTNLQVTYINLLDNTVEGIECEKDRVRRSIVRKAPGPQDSKYLFGKFIRIMQEVRDNA